MIWLYAPVVAAGIIAPLSLAHSARGIARRFALHFEPRASDNSARQPGRSRRSPAGCGPLILTGIGALIAIAGHHWGVL